jgi:hypothetical protein
MLLLLRDRSELLIITNQSDTRLAVDGEPDCSVEGEGVGHAGLVDNDQRRPADPAAQSGSLPFRRDQASLAKVSARMPVCSLRTAAAAADGARPITWPPASVQARVRARMAVVFPAPAGAIASCRREPEVHICRTRAAWPASSAVPFTAISSNARSTATWSAADPSVVRRWRRDGPRRRGSAARCTGRRRRRCRPTTRRPAATPPVPRRCQPVRPAQRTDDRAPHRPTDPPAPRHGQRAGRWCVPVVALRPGRRNRTVVLVVPQARRRRR